MPRKIAVSTLNASTVDILNTIRANASQEYQNLVPEITKADEISRVGEVVMGYPALANQFLSALVNRIASVRVKSATFNNAYAQFKKGYLEFGETVEEVFVNICKAREFSAEKAEARELKRSVPDVRSAMHIMNWRVQYPLTIQHRDLERAFLSPDGVTDLIAKTITESASSTDADSAQVSLMEVEVGGESIAIEPYTGDKYQTHYWMTKPKKCFAGEMEASRIEGGIRGLYADKVVMVNPSDGQIADLGLSHASMHAEYPDVSVNLRASAPDSDGNVYVMVEGRNIIYQLAADKVAWADTSYEKLKGDYALSPKLTALKGLKINDRDFTLSTRVSHKTDDEGNETTSTVTTVFEGKDEIQIENFQSFYDEVAMIALADNTEANAGGSPELTLHYTFDDDTSDTVEFYAAGDSKYVVAVNGDITGHARKSDITRVLEDLEKVNA